MTLFVAFICMCAATVIGELVSYFTKAWIPSVFITAICFLIGYWTFFPADIATVSGILPFGGTCAMFLCLTHMGTIISIKQLLEQWKVIVVCLAGLLGMCIFSWLICTPIIGSAYVVAGLPPLTGGIVAATTMRDAYEAAGNELAALFAITMYCMQGFAGYPLTAIMLKLEGNRLLKEFRSGNAAAAKTDAAVNEDSGNLASAKENRKKLIPEIPVKLNSTAMILLRLYIVAFIASKLGSLTGLSAAIWALLVAILATQIGFLDEDSLGKAKSYGFVMFALMIYIFDGLKTATPDMIIAVVGPMVLLIVVGVAGMALFCFLVAKVLRMTFPMAFACALTALYGFPPNAIITENTCKALADTDEEFDYLMAHMFPRMIVGGFTTVTITSVLIAGVFASWVANGQYLM